MTQDLRTDEFALSRPGPLAATLECDQNLAEAPKVRRTAREIPTMTLEERSTSALRTGSDPT